MFRRVYINVLEVEVLLDIQTGCFKLLFNLFCSEFSDLVLTFCLDWGYEDFRFKCLPVVY